MRMIWLFLLLVACALLAGCSKPLEPRVRTDGNQSPSPSGVTRTIQDAGSPQTFTVELEFIGNIVTLAPDLEPQLDRNARFFVTQHPAPFDTVPAHATLKHIRWVPGSSSRASEVAGAATTSVDADPLPDPEARNNAAVFPVGAYSLTLQAPKRAGGGTVTVSFVANFTPDTWWAGPEPERWPVSSDGDGRAVDVTDWARFTTMPPWPPDGRDYFGPDSFRFTPSRRRPAGGDVERRTFYEIFGDRIYARVEGDTVHQNSWVVFCNGGYDKDSEYKPRVNATDPALPPDFGTNPGAYPLLQDLGLIGSPIGFRLQAQMRLPDGTLAYFAQSGLYPVFDPLSVFRLPQVAGYWRAALAGKVCLVARAQDGDGQSDDTIVDPLDVAERVDAGGGTPEERLYRRKIVTFYVRPAPAPGSSGAIGRAAAR